MDMEKKIVSYLRKYGNTRESDIVNFGTQKFSRSSKDVKKIVDRMVVKGKVHRVIHNKLKPPEVYISLKELLPSKIEMALIELNDQKKATEEDARKILEEAAAVAEKKIKENNL